MIPANAAVAARTANTPIVRWDCSLLLWPPRLNTAATFTQTTQRMGPRHEGFVEIAKRPVPDVLVIGHTDAVGTDQVNDKLSRDRADFIRAGLIQSGIAPENIVAIGRGKRELFVPTADGVAHPRNRRVEIVVR